MSWAERRIVVGGRAERRVSRRASVKDFRAGRRVSGVRRSGRVVKRDCLGRVEEPDWREARRFWTRVEASAGGDADVGAVPEALGK